MQEIIDILTKYEEELGDYKGEDILPMDNAEMAIRSLIEAERKAAVEDYRCNVTQGILSRTQDNPELTEFINKIDSEYLTQKQEREHLIQLTRESSLAGAESQARIYKDMKGDTK